MAPLLEMLGLKRLEYTCSDSQRVSGFSRLIGLEMRLSAQYLESLEIGALLHDIGKAGIPHNVLMKPAPLNEKEWRIMKMHPHVRMGATQPGCRLRLRRKADIVYSHITRASTVGEYPRGLRGEEIPIGARVFAIADTLDAIVSDRPYRRGQPLERAAREKISLLGGTQFDPEIVSCFERIADEKLEVLRELFKDKAEPD